MDSMNLSDAQDNVKAVKHLLEAAHAWLVAQDYPEATSALRQAGTAPDALWAWVLEQEQDTRLRFRGVIEVVRHGANALAATAGRDRYLAGMERSDWQSGRWAGTEGDPQYTAAAQNPDVLARLQRIAAEETSAAEQDLAALWPPHV